VNTAAGGADLERRFGGLRRLYGDAGYERIRAARVAVVGLGGVGSWCVEALARSGVAGLVLIDLDHVAESNINRQVQATSSTLGMSKAQALAERVASIHPGCDVMAVEAFVEPDNWPALLAQPVQALIDACDQRGAKLALARWAVQAGRQAGTAFVTVGAAGGKQAAEQVQVADLAHDPLLASLRQALRKQARAAAGGSSPSRQPAQPTPLNVCCVFSREAVQPPADQACAPDGSLNCHGYGSSVAVTATFGMVAAGQVLQQIAHGAAPEQRL
jgi:tRNA threonylcarbamoyladenosine dehydratase